jgi:hypothetical protein
MEEPISPEGLRDAIERLRRQALEYGKFLKSAVAKGGTPDGSEPAPISQKAIEVLEAQVASVFEPRRIRFQRLAEFREAFKNTRPHPGGGVFGVETAQSLEWVYSCIYQWLDELLARANGLNQAPEGLNQDPELSTAPYFWVACAAALIGGLLLPKAAFHSLDRGLLVWIVLCIGSGVILSNLQPLSAWRGLKTSMWVSALMIGAMMGFYWVRWLVSRIININAPRIEIPFGSGASIDILDPAVIPFLIVLLVIFWIGTSIATGIATLSGRLLVAAALKLYAFGPEGVERVHKIIVALAGLVLALVGFWAAFG